MLFSMENAVVFEVIDNTERIWYGKWPGVLRPELRWETELQPEGVPMDVDQPRG